MLDSQTTPTLHALLSPAVDHAEELLTTAHELRQTTRQALTDLTRLRTRRRALVEEIERLHDTAAAQAETHRRRQLAADPLSAATTVLSTWRDVPQLLEDEATLRRHTYHFNNELNTTIEDTAARLDRVRVTPPSEPDLGDRLHQLIHTIGPRVQDLNAQAGNLLASAGNAVLHHPADYATLAASIALMAIGGSDEIISAALDATGLGTLVGIPAGAAGIAITTAGAALATDATANLARHAQTDDQLHPFRTDHAERGRQPNEKYPGRDRLGQYTKDGNEDARRPLIRAST